MDADRVRSYLQVACAGLGFDIGEVWWMSNDSGNSAVAAIEEKNGHESDSSGEGTYAEIMKQNRNKKKQPKKRFLQLYTSKAYCDQRSKLVQPHEENEDGKKSAPGSPGSPGSPPKSAGEAAAEAAASTQRQLSTTLRRSASAATLKLDEEHVLSPRIVEAVTHSTQVVWANCQKSEGLLGRSDIKLQTAIGMPVGVDESGNVWVVVMFSPKNVESTSDAIDYLQYISRSAASTSIPCLLPVVGEPAARGNEPNTKMICNGSAKQEEEEAKGSGGNTHSLVSIKPTKQRPNHTEEIGDGVMAKFVSFNLNDDDEESKLKANSGELANGGAPAQADVRGDAPKTDAYGIPVLPSTPNRDRGGSIFRGDAIDDAITDAFDEASYGVWSTIMNTSTQQQQPQQQSAPPPPAPQSKLISATVASNLHLIQERLEEFAMAFLGMSVFDVADAWMVKKDGDGGGNGRVLDCLFTATATETNPGINALRDVNGKALIDVGNGAVGKAFSSGYPVWSSDKTLIYDNSRKGALEKCEIETVFAVPIFSTGDTSPSCILSCYSLLPAESVPFVLNFVQKAVRLLWGGLDRVLSPHVGKELWKDVGPADLGQMAADLEMQKEFISKKRPRSTSLAQIDQQNDNEHHQQRITDGNAGKNEGCADDTRERSPSLAVQLNSLPNLAAPAVQQAAGAEVSIPSKHDAYGIPINAPPIRGLSPAPLFPNTVQDRPPGAQEFVFLDGSNDGHWAVQQAVQSVGDVQLWNNGPATQNANGHTHTNGSQQDQPKNQGFKMAHFNYEPNKVDVQQEQAPAPPATNIASASPPVEINSDIYQTLVEINAMAQGYSNNQPAAPVPFAMHKNNNSPTLNGTNHAPQRQQSQQPSTNNSMNLDKMVVVPISKSQGSVILTGPQQNMMYCTANPHGVNTQMLDPSLFAYEEKKPCRIEGCTGIAVAKRPYCPKHCGNRQCEREGCKKCAQGATRFCIAHGGGRRCTFPGCDKGARDKYYCAAHGGGKRCKTEGCNKSAVGGSNFCTGHGGGKRCQVPGCDKSAQSSTKFCVKHGGGKKCQFPNCEKVARGRTLYCAAHGGGVRCKLEGCNRVAIGKAQLCRAHGGGANSHFMSAAI